MARYVITTAPATIGSGNGSRMYHKNEVVELSASELATLTGAGGAVRTLRTVTANDVDGEAFAVSNGS